MKLERCVSQIHGGQFQKALIQYNTVWNMIKDKDGSQTNEAGETSSPNSSKPRIFWINRTNN
jgi:hypothetical protein